MRLIRMSSIVRDDGTSYLGGSMCKSIVLFKWFVRPMPCRFDHNLRHSGRLVCPGRILLKYTQECFECS